jgi:Mrp family chromosome partitioning ATPase
MQELTSKFDHVIVDTPAAAIGVDSAVVAARCGSAVVVARKNASRVTGMQDLLASLTGSGVEVVGAIVNEF